MNIYFIEISQLVQNRINLIRDIENSIRINYKSIINSYIWMLLKIIIRSQFYYKIYT